LLCWLEFESSCQTAAELVSFLYSRLHWAWKMFCIPKNTYPSVRHLFWACVVSVSSIKLSSMRKQKRKKGLQNKCNCLLLVEQRFGISKMQVSFFKNWRSNLLISLYFSSGSPLQAQSLLSSRLRFWGLVRIIGL